jgi:hypothetical protein
MGRQRHTAEQIIGKLREAEVLSSKGMPMEVVLRQLGISNATYHKWRKEYGGRFKKMSRSPPAGSASASCWAAYRSTPWFSWPQHWRPGFVF